MFSIRLVGAASLMVAGAPAVAIAPQLGGISALGIVNQAGNGDIQDIEQSISQFTAGFEIISAAPAVYNASAQATVASAFTTASWDRPDQGYVLLHAGWFSNNGGSGDATSAKARASWGYFFETGNRPARLDANWTYDVTGDPSGIVGLTLGFDRMPMAFNSAGTFSVQLLPNTAYGLSFALTGERFAAGGLDQEVNAQSLFNWSISSVPEPKSWAMLIAGFGLVGASMRRRRSPAVVAAD